jgi:hypothetical protein
VTTERKLTPHGKLRYTFDTEPQLGEELIRLSKEDSESISHEILLAVKFWLLVRKEIADGKSIYIGDEVEKQKILIFTG